MADRLRELIDLVRESLDEPGADGRALGREAHFSRDHLDRLLATGTGESPVALRRRLLLERAGWQLRTGAATPSEAAAAADYGSLAAFSRAFTRAYGVPPREFAGVDAEVALEAPNGIHFHPPAGLLIPGSREPSTRLDLTDRLVSHHLDRVRDLLAAAKTLDAASLERPLRPGFVAVWFEGEEASAALMAERLVFACFARRVRDSGAWDDAFVDALCEPPETFTYGGVLAHVLGYGAVRREALASVLVELGAEVPASSDPIEWERQLGVRDLG